MEEKLRKGWFYPLNSKKAHYVVGGRSLCGKWGYLGNGDALTKDEFNSPDDCKECRRKLEAKKKKDAKFFSTLDNIVANVIKKA